MALKFIFKISENKNLIKDKIEKNCGNHLK